MSQPIALGTVLGGRYQVTAVLLGTSAGDHVLQGEDQNLRRRVSIVVPAAEHEHLLVANARTLATGSARGSIHVLDMGQAEDTTYLVTSYAPAADLLDVLLVAENELEDDSLSDDIFGNSRGMPSSPYVYDEPDPTQPVGGGETQAVPAVTRWDEDDYEAFSDAPAAPSVRSRLGRARRIDPESTRATLFDRAAAGSSGVSAAAAAQIDPTYDGDNRYESFERTEGKPERLTGYPVVEDDGAATGAAGAGPGSAAFGEPTSPPGAAPARPRNGRRRPLRALALILLAVALVAAVILGFRSLDALTARFQNGGTDPGPPAQQASSAPATQQPSSAPSPEIASVSRLTPQPDFMADTDTALGRLTDGNPSTYWLSYGFSNPTFGNLIPYAGLTVKLQDPAPVSEVVIDQASGTGGLFNIYVSDTPSLDGAERVGSGSFTGPQITIPLDDAAQKSPHPYVLVVWDQLPQLTDPIGGYSHGLRIGEIQVR